MTFKFATLAVTTVLALAGCSSGDGFDDVNQPNPPIENKAEVDLSDKVTYVELDDVKKIKDISITDDGTQQITVSAENIIAQSSVDDLLFIPKSDENHFERIIVVESKSTNSNGDMVVSIRPATPNEAFDSIKLSTDTAVNKPNIEGIILPNGEFVEAGAESTQVGVLPTVKLEGDNKDGWKVKLDYNTLKAKRTAGMTDAQFANATIECKKLNDLYETKKEWFDQFCDTGMEINGTITYKSPTLQTNLDMAKDPNSSNFSFKSTDLNYIQLSNASIAADIQGSVKLGDVALSDMLDQSHVDLYKSFEDTTFGSPEDMLYAKLSGLSASDKKGKIPIFGVVVGATVPGYGGFVFNGSNTSVKQTAATVGTVLWVYGIFDISAEGKVTLKLELEPTNFDVGIENINNEWQAVSKFTNQETGQAGIDARFHSGMQANVHYINGIAIEDDVFLAGVRLVNFGLSPQYIVNGDVALDGYIGTLAPHYGGSLCYKNVGMGYGIRRYFNLDIQGNFKAGKGWATVEGGTGVAYSYQSPKNPLDKNEDVSLAGFPLWNAEGFDNRCFSTVKPTINVKSVAFDERAIEGNKVPVQITVGNSSTGTVKTWQLKYTLNSQDYTLNVKPNEDGILELDNSGSSSNKQLWLPIEIENIKISAVDYVNQQGSVEKAINVAPQVAITGIGFDNSTVDATCNNVKLYVDGVGRDAVKNLSLDVDGETYDLTGNTQVQVSGNAHLFHAEKVVDLGYCGNKDVKAKVELFDGKKANKTVELPIYGNGDIVVTNVTTIPEQLYHGDIYELIIQGVNLPDEQFKITGCSNKRTPFFRDDVHTYECTVPNKIDAVNIIIKTPDGSQVLNTTSLDVESKDEPISTSTSKLLVTGITKCLSSDDNLIDCTIEALGADWFGLNQDGEVQAGLPMSYELLVRNNEECIRDEVTELVWEQKTNDGGLRDTDNTYTWYNPNNNKNGGMAGKQDGGSCTGSSCDTQAYIQALNNANYCGYSDWRLPSPDELRSIVDYGNNDPAINGVFQNTRSSYYWTSNSASAVNRIDGKSISDYAWAIHFFYGNDYIPTKDSAEKVRAVR